MSKKQTAPPAAAAPTQASAPDETAPPSNDQRGDPIDAAAVINALRARVDLLEAALKPLAAMPVEANRPPTYVMYVLSRGGSRSQILAGDILAARKLVGEPQKR